MRWIVVMIAAVAALAARPALAWGEFGHHSTASIAWANISPQTRAAVRELLKAEKGLGTPYCHVRSLEEASYWPDCIRRESWRWGYSFPWHYQTMNICKPYDPRANCANGNCVTGQIERNQARSSQLSEGSNWPLMNGPSESGPPRVPRPSTTRRPSTSRWRRSDDDRSQAWR